MSVPLSIIRGQLERSSPCDRPSLINVQHIATALTRVDSACDASRRVHMNNVARLHHVIIRPFSGWETYAFTQLFYGGVHDRTVLCVPLGVEWLSKYWMVLIVAGMSLPTLSPYNAGSGNHLHPFHLILHSRR